MVDYGPQPIGFVISPHYLADSIANLSALLAALFAAFFAFLAFFAAFLSALAAFFAYFFSAFVTNFWAPVLAALVGFLLPPFLQILGISHSY